ncbi:MAG: GNAT family N-acetyltransferase [Simkaniaceae bacterium]|nr:GNAT family N-acetyltransferase [Simkaniaceae bacterium]
MNLQKKSIWSLEEIRKAMHINMHFQMTYFAKYISTMEIVVEPDVTVVRSSIPDDTFNYVISAHFQEENATSRVTHILSLFKKLNLPFSWWVSELDTPSFLGDILLSEGLTRKEEDIGMYAELLHLEIPPITPPLSFQRATSLTHLKQFADVITAIGGSPQSFDLIYSKLPRVLNSEDSSFSMHIAYLDNIPIVTGILVTHANVAGIYYIATIPEQRCKGFGTAMMYHLLGLAKEKGYFIATLQASAEGLSLYERLGFKRCSQFIEYSGIHGSY